MKPGGSIPHSKGLSNNPRVPRPCEKFLNQDGFYSVRLLASHQTLKLEDHSWLAVHDCLFNIMAANLWRPTYPSPTRGNAPCRGDRNSRMDK
jgi:hypothetical protein